MDDYVKAHQGVPLFDEEWRKQQKPSDPTAIKNQLLTKIPQSGKYEHARRLVDEVCSHNLTCKNFYIARRIWRDRDRRSNSTLLTLLEYQKSDKNYSQRVKNLHKTVRRFIEPAGFAVSFHKNEDTTEIKAIK